MKTTAIAHACLCLLIAALLTGLGAGPACALTQHDWAVTLIDATGRSFGLPDAPQPDDYLKVLSGRRNFRFEAEEVRSPDDSVSRMAMPHFGAFSGSGWLLGISRPVDVHLRFTLPLDGHYRLAVALCKPGHTIRFGEKSWQADGPLQNFATIDLGEIALMAGPQEVTITLPPGGAIDFLTLQAPDLAPIAPDHGWQPSTPLSWNVLATTAIQVLQLGDRLPLVDEPLAIIEAETLPEISESRVVEDAHRGIPSAGRWLRTSVKPAELRVPLPMQQGAFVDLALVIMGETVKVKINDHLEMSAAGKPYLDEVRLPTVYLPTGENLLTITLAPRSGIDRITVLGRKSDLSALTAALDVTAAADPPTTTDLDRLSARLATVHR